MTQSHLPYSNHAASQAIAEEQTEVSVNDMPPNDLLNTGIIIHDSDAQTADESNCQSAPHQFAILIWLNKVCHWLVDSFSSSSELQVQQKRDRNGDVLWLIYDPITRHSAQLSSEEEARIWIEQSYQRRLK